MKKLILKISTISITILICASLVGCTAMSGQKVRSNGKPWRKKVIRPENPYKKALWIPGDWRWEEEHDVYIWIPGRWFELEKDKSS